MEMTVWELLRTEHTVPPADQDVLADEVIGVVDVELLRDGVLLVLSGFCLAAGSCVWTTSCVLTGGLFSDGPTMFRALTDVGREGNDFSSVFSEEDLHARNESDKKA